MKLLVALPCFLLILSTHGQDPCPVKKDSPVNMYSVMGQRCFEFVIDKEVYWEVAESYCRTRGGFLATVDNVETQTFLVNALSTVNNHDNGVWIGLHDRNKESHYEWLSGTPYNYTHWDAGQPGILHSFEDCVMMKTTSGYKWHPEPCHLWPNYFGFVCEYLPATSPPATTKSST